jgi:hypothetical protein
VNTVVLAPMPKASARMAKKEKAGALVRLRNPYVSSRRRSASRLPQPDVASAGALSLYRRSALLISVSSQALFYLHDPAHDLYKSLLASGKGGSIGLQSS